MDIGEVRSFVDRVRGLPEGRYPTQAELASWLDPKAPLHERAYAASQLLSTGKTRLCFVCAFSNGGFAHLNGMNFEDDTVMLIPSLVPWNLGAAKQLDARVILRWLPRMDGSVLSEETGKDSISAIDSTPQKADALALDAYFEHFKALVDRHTLLLREG